MSTQPRMATQKDRDPAQGGSSSSLNRAELLAAHWKDDGSDRHRHPWGAPWVHSPECLALPPVLWGLWPSGCFANTQGLCTFFPAAFCPLQFLHLMSPTVFPQSMCDISSVPLNCIWLHKVGSQAASTKRRVCSGVTSTGRERDVHGEVQP